MVTNIKWASSFWWLNAPTNGSKIHMHNNLSMNDRHLFCARARVCVRLSRARLYPVWCANYSRFLGHSLSVHTLCAYAFVSLSLPYGCRVPLSVRKFWGMPMFDVSLSFFVRIAFKIYRKWNEDARTRCVLIGCLHWVDCWWWHHMSVKMGSNALICCRIINMSKCNFKTLYNNNNLWKCSV